MPAEGIFFHKSIFKGWGSMELSAWVSANMWKALDPICCTHTQNYLSAYCLLCKEEGSLVGEYPWKTFLRVLYSVCEPKDESKSVKKRWALLLMSKDKITTI
jgi:hypothetical protein